jgi:dolichyl-phosphooligosaccharide-protein glycotransferase
LLLLLPTIIEAIGVSESETPLIVGDWYESLSWLRENSNSTSFYDNPKKTPEYGVMSWWDYGNWILYLSKRPVVASNFQAGAIDSAKFYLSDSEEAATALLDARKSRYILADYDMFFDRLAALCEWVDEDVSSYVKFEKSGSHVRALLQPRLFNTTIARLYLFDGASTKHFRLIYESDTSVGNPPQSRIKIFEYVPGALIHVKASPDKRVGGLVNMTSNQGRPFTYVNVGEPENGGFAIRVPYSTEKRYGTRALGPYTIFSGNEKGVETQNLIVNERDVLEGRDLEVSFS